MTKEQLDLARKQLHASELARASTQQVYLPALFFSCFTCPVFLPQPVQPASIDLPLMACLLHAVCSKCGAPLGTKWQGKLG